MSVVNKFFLFLLKLKIVLILLVIAGAIAYVLVQRSRPVVLGTSVNGKQRESIKVKSGDLAKKLTISGSIDADEHTTLRFKTSGLLSWVGVKEGDYVKKNQVIASLDQRELKKLLQKELNDYMTTRQDYDQASKVTYKDLVITDTIKRAINEQQLSLNNSVLDVEIQNLTLQFANLISPIEGFITRVGTQFAGTNITPSQAEFDVVNPNTVYFSANADQTEVIQLFDGQSCEIVLDAFPEQTLRGKIKNISFTPKSGETGTVYNVHIDFQDPVSFGTYRLGMTGDITFTTQQKSNIVYVPSKFIKEEKGKKFVLVKQKDILEKIPITTGMETDDDIEILKGVEVGTTVYD